MTNERGTSLNLTGDLLVDERLVWFTAHTWEGMAVSSQRLFDWLDENISRQNVRSCAQRAG